GFFTTAAGGGDGGGSGDSDGEVIWSGSGGVVVVAEKYCDYNGEKGHYTNDCYHLKRKLEAALESRKLNHLVKDVRQRGNNRGRQPGNNNGRGRVINMLVTGHQSPANPNPDGASGFLGRAINPYRKVMHDEGIEVKELEEAKESGEEKVLVNPTSPEQMVTIGIQFSAECRERLINQLKNNMDVFAWQPSDMIGVPR
ncbi:hypothetical protein Tco_0984499, partial [Tanacetum coccineum]